MNIFALELDQVNNCEDQLCTLLLRLKNTKTNFVTNLTKREHIDSIFKDDHDDALKLARMAVMGELKGVLTPSFKYREFRSLIKYRNTLDGRINKTKNALCAWFVNQY